VNAQPGYIARRVANMPADMGQRISNGILSKPLEIKRRAELMRAKSGKLQSSLLKKSWATRRALGQKAFGNHGNGCPPSEPEIVLMALFPDAKYNHVILSHRGAKSFLKKTGYQHYCRPDLAWPEIKLAVEIDGESHERERQIVRDLKKEEVLRSLGWSVLRFSNEEVLTETTRVQGDIQSTISKLSATPATV
jgi:hypothetical protein